MNEEIRKALEKEVLRELETLETLQSGSKEQQTAVECVSKLYRLGLDEVKIDTDYEEKVERRQMDTEEKSERRRMDAERLSLESKKLESDSEDRIERRQMDAERLKLDSRRTETDIEDKDKRLELESRRLDLEEARSVADDEYRNNQTEDQKTDRWIKYGLEAAGIILPMAFYAIWMKKGFKFEETGTYTSTTFRGLFNKFRPTK